MRETEVLEVPKIKCEGCAETITAVVKSLAGVHDVTAGFRSAIDTMEGPGMKKQIVVLLSLALLALVFIEAGETAERVELRVDGMVCPMCEWTVERILRAQPGVIEADASFRTGRAVVVYDPKQISPAELMDAVNKRSFYRARLLEPGEGSATPKRTP